MAAFKTVSWSDGEPINMPKLEQMAINSDVIKQEILKRPMGELVRANYIGASITAGNTVISVPTFTLNSGRFLKITLKGQYQATAVNSNIRYSFENIAATTVYMSLYAYDSWDNVSVSLIGEATASRIMYASPGTYSALVVRIYSGATATIGYEGNAATLIIEDIGAGANVYPDQLKVLI